MNIILFLFTLLFLFISIGLVVYNRHVLRQISSTKVSVKQQIENKEALEQEAKQLQSKNEDMQSRIKEFNSALQTLQVQQDNLNKSAKERAEQVYLNKVQELEKQFQLQLLNKEQEITEKEQELNIKILELRQIEDTQLAYIQAKQKEKEMREREDYFRLVLSEEDLEDVQELRKLQKGFSKKEVIDKLIWDVYYKPAYDVLMPHIFKGAKDVCGIYRITDRVTGLAYIGQSVGAKERFRQHIKTSLAYGRSTNKLYQCMKDSGQHNFIFEILEEVPRDKLNEREAYWINFYRTKEYGLNSQRGNA